MEKYFNEGLSAFGNGVRDYRSFMGSSEACEIYFPVDEGSLFGANGCETIEDVLGQAQKALSMCKAGYIAYEGIYRWLNGFKAAANEAGDMDTVKLMDKMQGRE